MKITFKPTLMPWVSLVAGFIGFALRVSLFMGEDEKGLLPADHVAHTLTFVLTAAVLVILYLCVQPLSPMARHAELFPASIYRAIGCVLGAAGILVAGIQELSTQSGLLCVLTFLAGAAAAASLIWIAVCRYKGKRPKYLFHAVITVFFMLYTVTQCKTWGAEPELQRICFQLFACVFLMLTCYQYALLDAQVSSRRRFVFYSQSALFFCCMSLCGGNLPLFIGMIGWLALDLCSLQTIQTKEA